MNVYLHFLSWIIILSPRRLKIVIVGCLRLTLHFSSATTFHSKVATMTFFPGPGWTHRTDGGGWRGGLEDSDRAGLPLPGPDSRPGPGLPLTDGEWSALGLTDCRSCKSPSTVLVWRYQRKPQHQFSVSNGFLIFASAKEWTQWLESWKGGWTKVWTESKLLPGRIKWS